MVDAFDVKLPDAFTAYIEQNYYSQVTEQSKLDVVVQDPGFLNDPLKHVALFSDHGILHGRDIADKITRVLRQINGVLIPHKTPHQLEFMLGYGTMLAYLHDIGMKNFSAFGRAMHPEFAAQLMFTAEFDPWVELLWRENAGNVAWRLINLAADGMIQHPQRVLRELLALSMAHSKSKVPMTLLNDVNLLRQTMQHCVGTEMHYLYHQQQVAIAQKKLAQSHDLAERDRWQQRLEHATSALALLESKTSIAQRRNADIYRYYNTDDQYEIEAFSWLVSDAPEVQQFTVDVIDTVRALRCADALRQRGTAFKTSAGYEVITNQKTANAIYALRNNAGTQLFLLEGKDAISAGEANISNSTLDREGNLRVAFLRGEFSTPEATHWAAYSAAVVIQDIQADVLGSFVTEQLLPPEPKMQIFVEGVDDNPEFAKLVCQQLGQLNPDLISRTKAVTSLQYADLNQVERYMNGIQPNWDVAEKLRFLDQVAKTGQKVDAIDLDCAFEETRLIRLKAGEVLIEQGAQSHFVYVPLQAGLTLQSAEAQRVLPPWVFVGDIEVVRGAVAPARIIAEQPIELLIIPKQIYGCYWYNSYSVEEFAQLFVEGRQPKLPTWGTPSLELSLQRLTRRRARSFPIEMHLMRLFPDTSHLNRFMRYLTQEHLTPGQFLYHQGDRPDALYIFETGKLSIVDAHSEQRGPLHTFRSGDWIGGGELYGRKPYQTSVRADEPSTLYRLSSSAIEQMQSQTPEIAQTVSQHLLVLLADWLYQAQQNVTTLMNERTELIERLIAPQSESL